MTLDSERKRVRIALKAVDNTAVAVNGIRISLIKRLHD